MTAYEILLKKEFNYYERIDAAYAELIVRIQDCCDNMLGAIERERPKRCDAARKALSCILESIPDLKNSNLQYQAYVPIDIFKASAAVVGVLLDKSKILHLELKKLFDNNESNIDRDAIEKAEEEILMTLAKAEFCISQRLQALAECK